MNKFINRLKTKMICLLTAAACTAAFAGCGSSADESASSSSAAADMPKVIIGQSSWLGYAPMYIAQDKGFFKKYGADVEIQPIESKNDSKSALAADRIQGISTTVDMHIMNEAAGLDITQILALDTSVGGDGIVAKPEYSSLEDLKGKKVALDMTGSATFFFFQYLISQKGMTLDQFDIQNMTGGDAGAAFVAGKVDAAVTFQPWLSKAETSNAGHTIVSSKDYPGIIVDTFAMKKSYLKEHPEVAKAIVNGWYDALDYMKTNPDDAIAIIAKHVGQKPEEVKAQLGDIQFYDEAGNKAYFGTPDNPGDFYKVSNMLNDLWVKLKIIDKPVDAASIIDGSYLDKIAK